MSKIFDNIETKFAVGLHAILKNLGVKRADFCVGYFNLRGWREFAQDIDALPGDIAMEKDDRGIERPVKRVCRLLIGMHRPQSELIDQMYGLDKSTVDFEKAKKWRRQVAADFRRQLTLGVPTKADELVLQTLRRQLVEEKVCVKLHLRHPLHAKLYLAHRPQDTSNPIMSIMGSSNLTFSGAMGNGELNAEFGDFNDNQKYNQWFNGRWDDTFSIDITQDLIAALDESWAAIDGPTPYEVYLKIMYHLSREARKGVSEYHLPAPFNKELFDFQKTAVKLTVRHLEQRGGAMIGDVVGLGKTITACAVAKFYEESLGASTLILCPPNLKEMWHSYSVKYDLKTSIRSIAEKFDAHKERFFKLVIIDESHNLRNADGQRYAMIKDLLTYQGNKVLLLTATPYNKDYLDLANQLKLFVNPDFDLGIRPERQIKAEGGDQEFSIKYSNIPLGSIRAFEKSTFADDWRDLMKLYLVRRTRTFIKKHYAKTDPASGRQYLEMKDGSKNFFPDRLPKSIKFNTTTGDMFDRLYCDRMMSLMLTLSLPRYGLQKYIIPEAAKSASNKECQILDNLSRAGKRMMGFCLSGFFKRMDSSGVAFLMSLYRHAVRNAMYLYAIDNQLDLPLRAGSELGDGIDEVDSNDGQTLLKITTDPSVYTRAGKELYAQIQTEKSGNVNWISPKFFKKSLATAIKKDNEILMSMLEQCGEWNPAADEKLKALEELITKTHANDKLLVFTQYSDTARYVAAQLQARGVAHVVHLDGGSNDVVEQVRLFSPLSNQDPTLPFAQQTRVLVTTDVLSEGHNLQDCHVVVNFDLPWAIIRLIQRAGRVDRIGQQASTVFCYSFFPQDGINKIIKLRDRLNDRINANAATVGSDEIFFDGNKQNLEDIFNEKSGILDEPDDGEVDLASQAFQIWESATKDNPKLRDKIRNMQNVVYATKSAEDYPAGVITYARTKSDNDVLSWLNAQGEVESQSPAKIFKALTCSAATPKRPPLPNHHELVAQSIAAINDVHAATMGVLGSKSSIKYRIFEILKNRIKENPLPLFEQQLKTAVDQIYSWPMKESAKNTLGRMLQQHLPVDDVIQTTLELLRENDLCVVPENDDDPSDNASIICSMGLSTEI